MNAESIVFRSWPKLFFAWPLALVAVIAGLIQLAFPAQGPIIGKIFLLVLAFDFLILSFEVSRVASLLIVLAGMTLILAIILINQKLTLLPFLSEWMAKVNMSASSSFYFGFASVIGFIVFCMFIMTRFDYWILTHQELVHKRGFLGDSERYSTFGLRFQKEIVDVFEYVLAGSGRVIISTQMLQRPLVLENVLGVNRLERKVQKIFGNLEKIPPMNQNIPPT